MSLSLEDLEGFHRPASRAKAKVPRKAKARPPWQAHVSSDDDGTPVSPAQTEDSSSMNLGVARVQTRDTERRHAAAQEQSLAEGNTNSRILALERQPMPWETFDELEKSLESLGLGRAEVAVTETAEDELLNSRTTRAQNNHMTGEIVQSQSLERLNSDIAATKEAGDCSRTTRAQNSINSQASVSTQGRDDSTSQADEVGVNAEALGHSRTTHAHLLEEKHRGGDLEPGFVDSRTTRAQISTSALSAMPDEKSWSSRTTHAQKAVQSAVSKQSSAITGAGGVNNDSIEQPSDPVTSDKSSETDWRTTGAQLAHNSRTTSAQNASYSRTTGAQPAHNSHTTHAHITYESLETRPQPAHDSRTEHLDLGGGPRTTRAQLAHNSRTGDQNLDSESRTTHAQLTHNSRTEDRESGLTGTQLAHNSRTTHAQLTSVSELNSRTSDAAGPRFLGLPRGRTQLSILMFLHQQQARNGGRCTVILSRNEIAAGAKVARSSVDNTIRRLIGSGLMRRLEASTASVGGGASFALPKQVINRLIALEGPDSRTVASSNSRTVADVSSCSYSTTTTNVDHHRRDAEKLQRLVAYLNLDEAFNVGANDLLIPFQESGGSLEHFAESTEHAAFYLSTPDAKTINHPKAWLIKQLRRGYYPAPANFRSREAQLEEAKIQAREAKAKEMRELRARKLEAEFDCWFADQDSKARQAILLAQEVGPDFATAQMVRAALRKHFATMTGALEFLE